MRIGYIALAVVCVLVVAGMANPVSAQAQEITPTSTPPAQMTDDGFFSDVRFGDILDIIGVGIGVSAVGALGIWLFRVQGARMKLMEQQAQSARDSLEEQRKRCADEIDQERRHTERLREQHAAAEELLQRQIEIAERAAGIDPSGLVTSDKMELPSDAKQNLSEILSLLREMKAASQRFEVVSPLPPEAIALEHLNQGNAYFAAEDFERALTEYSRALEVQPDDATTVSNRGTTLYHLDRHEEARAAYERALQLLPDDPEILTRHGSALGELGRHEEELSNYNRALQLSPNRPDTLNNRGATLTDLRQFDEALADYNRSLELRAGHPATFYNRACLLALWSKPADALEDLRRAIEGDVRYRAWARADADFDNIRNHPEYGPRFQLLMREEEPPKEGDDKD